MKHLQETLDQLGISYQQSMIRQFTQYRDLILTWNEQVNLTAIKDPEEFVTRHYIDSVLICTEPAFRSARRIIDVGTGAGFPGVPLAILSPDKEFVLMDSLNKRIRILEEITAEIGLSNVRLVHGRAEDLAQNPAYREAFDLCVSRAVARLSVLCEYCLPFVKVGGTFGAYKSSNEEAEAEIQEGMAAISILGGELKSRTLSSDSHHQILLIQKMRSTVAKYPRKAGTPEKSPLK